MSRSALLILAALATGCGILPGASMEAPPGCKLPPGTWVTFLGETPLEAHGLVPPSVESEEPAGGLVYVTNEEIKRFERLPAERLWCVVYGPESPMGFRDSIGPVPENWTSP